MAAALRQRSFFSRRGGNKKTTKRRKPFRCSNLVADVVKILFARGDLAQLIARQILKILRVVGFVKRRFQRGVFLPLRGKLLLQPGLLILRRLDLVLHAQKLNAYECEQQQYDDDGERTGALFLLCCHEQAPPSARSGGAPGAQTAHTVLL